MNTSEQTSNELITVLSSLISTAENTMDSVHSLQIASINANHGINTRPLRDMFLQMRNSLHNEWTSTEIFLRSCYDFSDKVVKFNENRKGFEAEEVQDYCEELAAHSNKLWMACGNLLCQHDELTKAVKQSTLKLNQLLSHPAAARRSADHFTPSSTITTRTSPRLPVRKATGDSMSETRDFIRSSLLAAYPDGLAALSSFTTSLAETRNGLTSIHLFLGAVCATALRDPFPSTSITMDGDGLRDNDWTQLRDYILFVIPLLPRVRDAISVERSLPGYPVRQSSLSSSVASSGTVEKPTSASSFHFRRVPSYEEIPRSCWGFRAGKKI
jgi:hypothetical protein